MKRSLMVMGLLSVVGLASITVPALSDTAIRTEREWSPVRSLPGPADGQGGLVRLAQADRDHGSMRTSDHGEDHAGQRGCCRDEARRMGRMGHHGRAHRWQPPGLRIAARLAQIETYVGITSAQLDVWRAYTSALIDFFERSARDRGPGGPPPADAPPPPPSQGEPGQAPADAGPVLFAERLADRAIARAEKARTLKTSLDALRAQLTPEQLDRLAKAERAFGPGRRPHGPGHPHHGGRAAMSPMQPEGMSEDASENTPEASPEGMPDESPEDMTPETPEDTPPEAAPQE